MQTSFGGGNSTVAGVGLIFRGGDTWHFGNSAASPYTGGTFNIIWSGSSSACAYEGNASGCFYIGVDQAWFNSSTCGSSWCRPVFTGDNPTSTTAVSSCAYQAGSNNVLVILSTNDNSYLYFDGFELTGLCSNDVAGSCNNGGCSAYVADNGTGNIGTGMAIKSNLYFHGWTVTSAIPKSNPIVCTVNAGGGTEAYVGNVIDGSDAIPGACNAAIFPYISHWKDNMFRYTTQIVATTCHDIHDNVFEHFYNPYFVGGHGNGLECNGDQQGPTPNVYYNNIMRHFDPSFGLGGQVDLWFCPGPTPEYWFNNMMYDLNPTAGQGSWDIAGPPTYAACTNSGGQYMFNNTLVDTQQPCYEPVNNSSHGQYLNVFNEHLIATGYDGSGTGGCNGGLSSPTNISMSDAVATAQGYTTGSPGTSFTNTCANDGSAACSPTSPSAATVGKGSNVMAYCNQLATYTSEYAIGTEAANACRFGTTDACTYNVSNHTMVCPAQTATARPASGAWDVGAYQFSSAQGPQLPMPPTSPVITVH